MHKLKYCSNQILLETYLINEARKLSTNFVPLHLHFSHKFSGVDRTYKECFCSSIYRKLELLGCALNFLTKFTQFLREIQQVTETGVKSEKENN